MEGKTFAEIWTEFIEVPTRIDPITSEKVLDADFYNLKAGTSLGMRLDVFRRAFQRRNARSRLIPQWCRVGCNWKYPFFLIQERRTQYELYR